MKKDELLEKTRLEREQRRILREQALCVLTLQKNVRRWLTVTKMKLEARKRFERKRLDVEKVEGIVAKTKQPFVVPASALRGLILDVVLFGGGVSDDEDLKFLCRLIRNAVRHRPHGERVLSQEMDNGKWMLKSLLLLICTKRNLVPYGDGDGSYLDFVETLVIHGEQDLVVSSVDTIMRQFISVVVTKMGIQESYHKKFERFDSILRILGETGTMDQYLLDIFCIPLLNYKLSTDICLKDEDWLVKIEDQQNRKVVVVYDKVDGAVWLTGNLLVLLHQNKEKKPIVEAGLNLLSTLLPKLPGQMFQGKMSVLWVSKDQCVAFPELLQRQCSYLTNFSFVRHLFMHCFSFLGEDVLRDYRAELDLIWDKKKQQQQNQSFEPTLKPPPSKSMFQKMKDYLLSSGSKKSALSVPPNIAEAMPTMGKSSTNTITTPPTFLPLKLAEIFAMFVSQWSNQPFTVQVLNAFAFSYGHEKTVESIWTTYSIYTSDGKLHEKSNFNKIDVGFGSLLVMFCAVFQHTLLVTDDVELYEKHLPLHPGHVERCIVLLKQMLFKTISGEDGNKSTTTRLATALRQYANVLLVSLYERHSRRPLSSTPETWIVSTSSQSQRSLLVKEMPYAIPFYERVRMFQEFVKLDREMHQERKLRFTVRRETIFDDAFRKLHGQQLKQRMYVVFINAAGKEETGIDAGGLFKELWTNLSFVAFGDDVYFKTTSDRLLYPNPDTTEKTQEFEFLGSIVGKALYEDIVIQPRFARFFLTKLLNKKPLCLLEDLPSLDPDLYKNLCFLKEYDGDVRDLCLTFSVHDHELVPGGENKPVTKENLYRYIHLVANYHLNIRLRPQSHAFLRGFTQLINLDWINMFTEPELQTLISGQHAATIDIQDLKKHTVYANGYFSYDPHVMMFWKVLQELTEPEKRLFLKFVTSCERPPLLGFQQLKPPLCIHKIPIGKHDQRIVTAQTCFNILKLPTYKSKQLMKQKLLFALNNQNGFELT